MPKYQRVTYEVRCLIDAFLLVKLSKAEIARRVGFHKSTISRELKRNSLQTYTPGIAETLARHRYSRCRRKSKVNQELIEQIKSKVEEGWSPEQLSGRLKLEKNLNVSRELIYRFLRRSRKTKNDVWRYLRRSGRKGRGRYARRSNKPDWFKSITQRPQEINNRSRLGDWERDLMCGLNRSAFLVCVERKSRFLKISKVNSYKAIDVFDQTTKLLATTETEIKSITNDNGPEFNDGYLSKVPVFYCQPHKPQQRGTVENTIGLLRQYHGKRSELGKVSDEDLERLELKMNNRPRRCLDYRTPYEVLYNTTVALVT